MRAWVGLIGLIALLTAGPSAASGGLWLSAPADGATIEAGATVTFRFGTDWLTGVFPGALDLQVARDVTFDDVVVDEQLPCPASFEPSCPDSATAGPFGPGTYWWRVRWLSRSEDGTVTWVPSEARSLLVGAVEVPTNAAPTAAFEFTPQHPQPGELVTFDGSGSRDPDGVISGYSWSFGNGNGSEGSPHVAATYDVPGSYTVTLVVYDDRGASAEATATVVVAAAAPPPAPPAPPAPPTPPGADERADTTPPTIVAIAGAGRHGKATRLWFRLFDDSRRSLVEATIKRRRTVLATLSHGRPFDNGLRYLVWRAPRRTGLLSFCVRARDAAANLGSSSCASLRIR